MRIPTALIASMTALLLTTCLPLHAQPIPGSPYGYGTDVLGLPPDQMNNLGAEGPVDSEARACRQTIALNLKAAAEAEAPPESELLVRRVIDVVKPCVRAFNHGMTAFHSVVYNHYTFQRPSGETFYKFGPGSWDIAHYVEGDALAAGKSLGAGDCGAICVGNPINVGADNKFQKEIDFEGRLGSTLYFERYYNSRADAQSITMGEGWRHTYSRSVAPMTPEADLAVLVHRDDGAYYAFTASQGNWVASPDVRFRLRKSMVNGAFAGWELDDPDHSSTEIYDASGRLSRIDQWDGFSTTLGYGSGNGPLKTITDHQGRQIKLEYTSDEFLSAMIDPTGSRYEYIYSDLLFNHPAIKFRNRLLIGVKQPTNVHRWYTYDTSDSEFGLLASIIDESGQTYATFRYFGGSPLISSHAGGIDSILIEDYSGYRYVTDALGLRTRYRFIDVLGQKRATSIVRDCTGFNCESSSGASTSYNANGYPESISGPSGSNTAYEYNSRGLTTLKSERTQNGEFIKTQTDWHSTFDVPLERRHLGTDGLLKRRETWTYNSRGQALTASVTDPISNSVRTASRQYCEATDVSSGNCPTIGLLKVENGERTDVGDEIIYAYYQSDDAGCATVGGSCKHRKGDLWRVTNALGHVTEITAYDLAGRPLSTKDLNGVVTDIEYNVRGWVTARKVRGTNNAAEDDDAITRLEYFDIGRVKKVTEPDGRWNRFEYDAAHRLVAIYDNADNKIHYTLDNAGNRIREEVKDREGDLVNALSRIYNSAGWLTALKDGYGRETKFSADFQTQDRFLQINKVTDPLGRVTQNWHFTGLSYLSFNQQDATGINAQTSFARDEEGRIVETTDPRYLKTSNEYDGFGGRIKLVSPDTGTTAFTYDSGGNAKSILDANGQSTTYTYDALNRIASKSFTGSPSLNETYSYDVTQAVCGAGETFNKGRMTKMTDGSGETRYCYDRWGNLARKSQVINGKIFTLAYNYDLGGRLASITYPSGAKVTYERNTLGQQTVIKVTPVGGVAESLVSNVVYYPYSIIGEIEYGNGRRLTRTHNLNFLVTSIEDTGPGGLSMGFIYDEVGNLKELRKADLSTPALRNYRYDNLDRLIEAKDGTTGSVLESYSYDTVGNRMTATRNGISTASTFAPGSHRLAKAGAIDRTYDTSGKTKTVGSAREYDYGADGRLRTVRNAGAIVANYAYDGTGEQVRRYASATAPDQRYLIYAPDGRLIGEYDNSGKRIQEIIWLGDQPTGLMAGVDATQNHLHYVQTDHVGTPRRIIDPTRQKAIWSWDMTGDTFGGDPPNQDPDADGVAFTFNMRFPGQLSDPTTGLHHNGYREYDPSVGRYLESDPIGLDGGLSTYGYAKQSPVNTVDPTGLATASNVPFKFHPYHVPLRAPGKSPAYSIYCVDGVVDPGYNMAKWDKDWASCKEIRDCAQEHEMEHARNALQGDPEICPKHPLSPLIKRQATIITFPDTPHPGQRLSELQITELYGHAVELRCLERKLREGKCDRFCLQQVVEKIHNIIHYEIPDIYNGTYNKPQ